jgi:hypothetical protein
MASEWGGRVGVDATFAGRRPRERYHLTGAEQSRILTIYRVVPGDAPGAIASKGGGLGATPALGPFLCPANRGQPGAVVTKESAINP